MLSFTTAGVAQTVDQNLWVTNGSVYAVAATGTTTTIGGSFTRVGPRTGGAVPIDASTGALGALPKVAGQVYAVAPDGSGGWFIGGQFTAVAGVPRLNIAHVASNMSVYNWNPGADRPVRALAVSALTLYVGGDFLNIGGQPRNRIAAVDIPSGVTTAWNPNSSGSVRALLVNGSTIYAGGAFSIIGGASRKCLAALSAATGSATAWNPSVNHGVLTLLLNGATLYAAGGFDSVGTAARSRLAAISVASGIATAWNPNANGTVNALALRGSVLYAGGNFTTIAGVSRARLAALGLSTPATASSWSPSPDQVVQSLAATPTSVYVGGAFSVIGGTARNYIAQLDTLTGAATSWNPNANNVVEAVALSGATLFAGGDFTSFGGVVRNNIAALDPLTGNATTWDPNANGVIVSLAVNGPTVYAGGNFTSIGGAARNRIAALSTTSGFATAWNPNADSTVNAIVVQGSTVYAGGAFHNIGGTLRNHLASLDATIGLANSWNPDVSDPVQAIVVLDPTVYVGGGFTSIHGDTRNYLAAIPTVGTGTPTSWNPGADGPVYALALAGNTLYVGGGFLHVGGLSRNYIASINASSATINPWNPNADSSVTALAVNGSAVYAGGLFQTIGEQPRNSIAELDAITGVATAWNANADHAVSALTLSGLQLYAGGSFSAMGQQPSGGIASIATLSLSGTQPSSGGNAGPLRVTVLGSGLVSGATVRLSRSGLTDIVGTEVTVAPNGSTLAATFDLTGAATGPRNVIVDNAGFGTATLTGGFTISAVAGPQLRIHMIGPPLIRANRRTAFDLLIVNPGNIDALYVPVWLTGVPLDATLELDFPLSPPPQSPGDPDWSLAPHTFTSPHGTYLPIVIPRIPPGTTARRVFLTVPTDSMFVLRAALTPPWVDGNVFRSCLSAGGVISNPACMGGQLTAINNILALDPSIVALSGVGEWAKIAWACEGAPDLTAAVAKAEQVLDFMVAPIEVPGSAIASCIGVLPPRWRDSLLVTIVGSFDPNEKLGASDTLSGQQAIPYEIRFENDPNIATAPAQQVVISDPLDLVTLDPNTVSLDVITFGNIHIVPPPGLKKYVTQVYSPTSNLLVNVNAEVDPFNGVLTWYFTSIDPATGQPPTSALAGFLPPNQNPPEGEGSVLFTVMPRPGLANGTQIHNAASITFDTNAPHATDDWLNTVDNATPGSHVLPLPMYSDLASVSVNWTAEGAPLDLKDYTVYVSEDGAPYRVWRLNTAVTGDTLVPPGDHHIHNYAFYSVARDASGNIEAPPLMPPDATTQSRTAVGDAGPWRLALEGARPNPAMGLLRVWFTLPSRDPATLEVVDIAGRRVLRREVGSLGPGPHSVALDPTPPMRPGLYFLRLAQGPRVLTTRVALVR